VVIQSRAHSRIDPQARAASAAANREGVRRTASQAASDATLIGRIAAGDPLAMQVLYARHHVRAFRFVAAIVKDRALAEDIIGEVFLDVWRQAARFEDRATVSTWLLAIARYKALDALRRCHVHEDLDEAAAVADPADDPETAVQTSTRSEMLRSCIAKLSQSHREIVDLVYYQDLTIEQVARVIGAPLNTVKTRMFYARKQLAVLLADAGLDRAAL
jgi:RNA polymerase sigma-70 factor (ECF subfamily)